MLTILAYYSQIMLLRKAACVFPGRKIDTIKIDKICFQWHLKWSISYLFISYYSLSKIPKSLPAKKCSSTLNAE